MQPYKEEVGTGSSGYEVRRCRHRHHRDFAATASTTPTYSDLHDGPMEIGKQRQVCHGFRLNQGSNPHDLLLDDPWDLTMVPEPI